MLARQAVSDLDKASSTDTIDLETTSPNWNFRFFDWHVFTFPSCLLASGNHHFILCFYSSDFFNLDFLTEILSILVFLCLAYCTWHNFLQLIHIVTNYRIFSIHLSIYGHLGLLHILISPLLSFMFLYVSVFMYACA
jgi:hypothetical protein